MATNVDVQETRYIPRLPPNRQEMDRETLALVQWLMDELNRISRSNTGLEFQYPPMSEAPLRYSLGMTVFADGVGWDPGSGEGLYVYKTTGWTFIA